MTAKRRRHLILGALALAAIVLVAWVLLHPKPKKTPPPHATPVATATVQSQDLPLTVTALGAAQAWTSDTIFAQVSGKLVRVNFTEGADVKAGQVLAEVDSAPYRAVLTQVLGTLRRDQAVLAGARVDLARYQRLLAEGAIARQTVEDQAATVAQNEGTVQIDQGQVAAARINLAYCRITSPISGRTGVRLVDPGNIVSASGSVSSAPSTASSTNNTTAASASTGSASSGGSGIVVVNQIQPIAVTFTVPEGEFDQLVRVSDGFRRALRVEARSQETNEVLDAGELSAADNRVNPATGTVELKARFSNAAKRLWPGQFVNATLTLQTLQHAVTVPMAAINRGPNGQYVFVVANGHAAMRPVSLSSTQGDSAVVKSGLRPGETVVIDGQMTLKNGALVRTPQSGAAGKPSGATPGGAGASR